MGAGKRVCLPSPNFFSRGLRSCKDKKWQWLSGTEVRGGNQLHRGPGGMKRKFHVSYGGGVCDSYMIMHISYSSLNPRRIKLVISKLYIPHT